MTEQQHIDSILAKIKANWLHEGCLCVFCGHGCSKDDCQTAHLIRRSESIPGYSRFELQTLELNIGPAHSICHEIFDNDPANAVYLPKILKVLDRIRQINENYYNRLSGILEPYWPQEENYEIDNEKGLLYLEMFTGEK